jgi:hypothetical protein
VRDSLSPRSIRSMGISPYASRQRGENHAEVRQTGPYRFQSDTAAGTPDTAVQVDSEGVTAIAIRRTVAHLFPPVGVIQEFRVPNRLIQSALRYSF